jgi:isoquinoline 1-oxidoreductase subunit alpha
MAIFTINVNGKDHRVDVAPDTPLLWVLRDHLRLLGTKYACGIAECGACTVHVDGKAVKSCVFTIYRVRSLPVITIEGLSEKGNHPVQLAWDEADVPQCGYCQAGQIMTAAAFLKQNPRPSDQQIDDAMHDNLCRCCAYHRIREAVKLASKKI